MNGLKKAGVNLDRKVLAQMAYDADKNFDSLIETAKRFIAVSAK
jgi:ribosomal protein L20